MRTQYTPATQEEAQKTKEWGEERLRRVRTLIQQLYAVVADLEEEFEGRKFTPDGHLVGSLGEVVAAYAFGLELLPASNEVHDAKSSDGVLVQIKLTGGKKGVALYSQPTHLLVLQLADKQFRTVYNGPGEPVWGRCGQVQKNGQRSISLSALSQLDMAYSPKLPQVRQFPLLVETQ
jgi:hypothetical protein